MMGVVYRAHDPALGRTVAVKTVQLAFPIADDQKDSFEQRFLAEARAAAGLSHPGIVVVHDVGRDPDSKVPYIALEYLEGHTLADRLAEGPLAAGDALRIAAQIADALHHAHERGIIHRDIKPANIMLLDGGAAPASAGAHAQESDRRIHSGVKIMDFGVAKVPASQLTSAGEFFGTPSYMSPEQALAGEVDGRSDLFSLGCVLYAMLTGERAFEGPSVPTILAMIAHKEVGSPSARRAGLSPYVDDVVARALAKDPTQRYPNGRAFAEDLLDVAEGRRPRHGLRRPAAAAERTVVRVAAGPPLPEGGASPAVRRLSRRGLLALAVAGGGLLLLLALLAFVVLLPGGLRSRMLSLALPVPPPAEVSLTVDHPLKTGTLRVYVDDALEVEEALEGRVVQKILSVEIRKGSLEKTFYVPPGEHVIRVQVDGETFSASRRITGVFESRATRRLHAEVAGLIKREVTLYWRD